MKIYKLKTLLSTLTIVVLSLTLSTAEAGDEWIDNWRHRISQEGKEKKDIAKLINSINPSYIPRNHRIEEIIDKALEGDYSYFELLNKVLNKPYNDQNKYKKFQAPPDINQIVTQTFCGT